MNTETTEKPSLCYQCSRCSTGCPVVRAMEIPPHRLMHLLALRREEKALAANTIWMCAGCFTCSTRCPNDIDIASVMDNLRRKAVALGIGCPKRDVLIFHRAFIRDLLRRGRIHELRMMGEFSALSGKLLRNATLGLSMLLKGRLPLLPDARAGGFHEFARRLRRKLR